jgi:hypothetical protein
MTGGWFIIGFATLLWTFLHLVSTCFGWRIGRALKWSVTHLQHVCVSESRVPESKIFENIEAQWHAATCCKFQGNGHIVVVAVVDLRAIFQADEISDSKTGTSRDVGTCWNTNLVMFAIVTRTRADLFTVVKHTIWYSIVNPTHIVVNYFSICWIFFWGGRYCNLSIGPWSIHVGLSDRLWGANCNKERLGAPCHLLKYHDIFEGGLVWSSCQEVRNLTPPKKSGWKQAQKKPRLDGWDLGFAKW